MVNQKLYLIPTTPSYEYEPYDHIYLVKAYSDQDAYNKAKSELDANIPKKLHEYESYNIVVYNLPTFPFHESKKYDILNPIFLSTKGFEHMAYFNVNWNDYINDLSELAAKEEWSSVTYPDKKKYLLIIWYILTENYHRKKISSSTKSMRFSIQGCLQNFISQYTHIMIKMDYNSLPPMN